MATLTSELTIRQQQRLVDLARRSIEYGLDHGAPVPVHREEWPDRLWNLAATFVTLHRSGRLRGCIGTVEPVRPLPRDVAHNGYAAAFHDPRFPSVDRSELLEVTIDISILEEPVPLETSSEADLIGKLRPGVDGLILRAGDRQGLFLPAVWETLPDPARFVAQLKRKAGLPADAWSSEWRFYRFGVTAFGESKGLGGSPAP